MYVGLKQVFSLIIHGNSISTDTSTYWDDELSGFEIWIVPKLFLALISLLAIDWPCQILTNRCRKDSSNEQNLGGSGGLNQIPVPAPTTEQLILASSWSALVFFCRPFTNTLETMVLSVLLVITSGDWVGCVNGRNSKVPLWANDSTTRCIRSIAVGILSSIGIFVRFTFAFFALPAVFVYLLGKGGGGYRKDTKDDEKRTRPLSAVINSLSQIFFHAVLVTTGFVVVSCAFVAIDTRFYSQMSPLAVMHDNERATIGGFYIAPLNALLYNSKIDNLGEHGLHPHITHLVVNLPMLFGPLAFFFYADIANITVRLLTYRIKGAVDDVGVNMKRTSNIGRTVCRLVTICGLFVLSCAPHQEPRFLLPVTVPLVVLYGRHLSSESGKYLLRGFWILFNMLLLKFFGFLHQGGVVPSLIAIGDIVTEHMVDSVASSGETIFFYHTYMPPSFLSRSTRDDAPTSGSHSYCATDDGTCSASMNATSTRCSGLEIVDLKGSGPDILRVEVMQRLQCSGSNKERNERVVVVAPASVWDVPRITGREYASHTLYTYQPHVTTEDMPAWSGDLIKYLSSMEISIHAIECN